MGSLGPQAKNTNVACNNRAISIDLHVEKFGIFTLIAGKAAAKYHS
jgi:hypothetical protein